MKKTNRNLEPSGNLELSVPSSRKELGTRISALVNLFGKGRDASKKSEAVKAAAEIAQLSVDQLHRYMSGYSKPAFEPIARMAMDVGVNMEWICTGEGPMCRANLIKEQPAPYTMDDEFVLVPLYDVEVSAGPGREVLNEEPVKHLAFRRDWLSELGLYPGKVLTVTAKGHSMEPTISHGDVLLIDTTQVEPGRDGVYIMSQQGMLRVKRLQWLTNGSVKVMSDNKAYSEERVCGEDVSRLHIVGRAVWGGRRL